MIYPNETEKIVGNATQGRPHLYKHSTSPLWRLAVERVVDGADNLIVLAEVGRLDNPRGIAHMGQLSIARATRVLARFSRNLSACNLVVDLAAVLAILFSFQYHLTPVGLLLAVVVGIWAACRIALLWIQTAAQAAADINLSLSNLCLAIPQLHVAEGEHLTQSARDTLLEVYTSMARYLLHTLQFVNSHQRIIFHQREWVRLATQSKLVMWQHGQLLAAAKAKCSRSTFTYDRQTLVQQHRHYSNVPAWLGSRFHARDDALQAMARALRPKQDGVDKLRFCVLYGISGVGKTELARQHVAQHSRDYSAIFWANASNLETLNQSFREIAQLIDPNTGGTQPPMIKVGNWLNNTDQSWLIIFDGADDLNVLEHVWPVNGRGSVLVTTRDHTGAQARGLDSVYNVRPFRPVESGNFLLGSTGIHNPSPDDQALASNIASRLGHLPLALSQASGFIVRRQLSLRDFLHKYRLQADAEEIDRLAACGGYSRSVASMWDDTFSRIPDKSLLLLNVIAFMGAKGVKEEVLYRGSVLLRKAHPRMGREAWKLMIFMNESMELSEAQEVLLKWGLISRDPQAGVVSMLRAVRQAAIRRLTNDERERFSFVTRELQRLTAEKGDGECEGKKLGRTLSEFVPHMAKQPLDAHKPTVRPTAPSTNLAITAEGRPGKFNVPVGQPPMTTLSEFAAYLETQQQGGGCRRAVRPGNMDHQDRAFNADLPAKPMKKRTLAEFVAYMATQPPGGGRSGVRPVVARADQVRTRTCNPLGADQTTAAECPRGLEMSAL